ncbi:DUF1697 domain-containing protein [Sphingobacterium sp.]|uniref:DUF1697 domain-containing protein n=1 Tax=Sphingobacterium sp. TaxID=341027 RepID=UPI00289E2243|nr:DUF1697 domain-containing protein [Sphingobacterium sp.]
MKYCAFLRGVNMKGTNMKMADVCQVFKDAGVTDVTSVLASGNIVFSSEKGTEQLKQLLEESMSAYFSYEAFLFIRSEEEVGLLQANIPFETDAGFHVYAFVGIEGVEKILMDEFSNATQGPGEEAEIVNSVFYWRVPKGNTLDSSFGKVLGKKNLKDKMTSRNINTFEKILKKMG